MGAAELAMTEILRDRLRGPVVTQADLERLRRLRTLGAAALSGGERSPELPMLASQCTEALYGPDCDHHLQETDRAVREMLMEVRLGIRTAAGG